MIIHNTDDTISFSIFADFPDLQCFMSTRAAGNLLIKDNVAPLVLAFLESHGIFLKNFVAMEQIHGTYVAKVKKRDSGRVLSEIDGLITDGPQLYLGVNAADCVPLFFYDPVRKLIGIIHAGWKGTLGNIAAHTIKKLQGLKSNPLDIRVAIGPYIGGCCYMVSQDRAKLFLQLFSDEKTVFQSEDNWHIDLGRANKNQLIKCGLLEEHIDSFITCTSCQNDLFFSYRKDSKWTFGEMLGVIGIKKV